MGLRHMVTRDCTIEQPYEPQHPLHIIPYFLTTIPRDETTYELLVTIGDYWSLLETIEGPIAMFQLSVRVGKGRNPFP